MKLKSDAQHSRVHFSGNKLKKMPFTHDITSKPSTAEDDKLVNSTTRQQIQHIAAGKLKALMGVSEFPPPKIKHLFSLNHYTKWCNPEVILDI